MLSRGPTIDELSKATKVPPRTIRSYIERDLMQGPERSGPGATYPEGSLERLQFIGVLRSKGIGFTQIHEVLKTVSKDTIRRVASGEEEVELLPLSGRPSGSGRDGQGSRRLQRIITVLRPLAKARPSPRHSESWLRVRVTPDLEIAVRGKPDGKTQNQLQELASLLRGLLEQRD